ncbi:hypothetical protein [Natribacillus halophilus]|uniref:Uncharacterized protein n=1 Tax=Natribacillus halophilus TaxID=549003 RepID=A0A1G8NCV8_9BACI|nr:hypothetical protein [Natribacillus halophilus]SDI78121.1 hypothetical protein SAMN04488123_10617 [Natribacillus halophilus]
MLAFALLIFIFICIESFSASIVSLFGVTEIPPYFSVLFIMLVLSCFYFLFLFEAKKDNNIFASSLWRIGPLVTGIVGAIAAVVFIVSAEFLPLITWMQEWRVLLYAFFGAFLFLVFLFVFSIVHKYQTGSSDENKLHLTLVLLFVFVLALFFLLG